MNWCRVCGAGGLSPLWKDDSGADWFRCPACGSDSSTARYDPALYDGGLVSRIVKDPPAVRRDAFRAPADWYGHFAHLVPGRGRDFLDVGFADDVMMSLMQERGWSVHGFDVHPSRDLGPHVTIHPHFAAGLFPRTFHAVFCGDVIEHVDGVRGFLAELTAVTAPGGLLGVQMPRPCEAYNQPVYHGAHLQILSPAAFEAAMAPLGWRRLDHRLFGNAQGWMFHLADKPG